IRAGKVEDCLSGIVGTDSAAGGDLEGGRAHVAVADVRLAVKDIRDRSDNCACARSGGTDDADESIHRGCFAYVWSGSDQSREREAGNDPKTGCHVRAGY